MRVGAEILRLARAIDAPAIFVVGTGRDVGKTTTVRAIYDAAWRSGARIGLGSVGAAAKPRFWLHPKTAFATARALLPAFPAAEILKLSRRSSAAGDVLYARTVSGGFYELAGPPTASGVREVIDELARRSEMVIVDGAIDRIAAVAGSSGAIVVAGGAAGASTPQAAIDDIGALIARLRVPKFDEALPAIEVDGALTPSAAADLIARGETGQVVVGDPTQIALAGQALHHTFARLTVRCRRPLRVIAATVASIGTEQHFEPRSFGHAVSAAAGLPTFDVYRGVQAA